MWDVKISKQGAKALKKAPPKERQQLEASLLPNARRSVRQECRAVASRMVVSKAGREIPDLLSLGGGGGARLRIRDRGSRIEDVPQIGGV